MPELNKIALSSAGLSELTHAVLSKKASFRLKVKGFSMSPFIKDNDIVTLSPLSKYRVSLGSPVAFVHPKTEKFIIHRIVGKKGNCYLIKGDRVPEADGLIPGNNLLGIVTKIERNGRRFLPGSGPERVIIAFLSRKGLLPFLSFVWKLIPFSIRRLVL